MQAGKQRGSDTGPFRILKLSVEERARMGKRARIKMEREFDRERVARDYYEEIQKCI